MDDSFIFFTFWLGHSLLPLPSALFLIEVSFEPLLKMRTSYVYHITLEVLGNFHFGKVNKKSKGGVIRSVSLDSSNRSLPVPSYLEDSEDLLCGPAAVPHDDAPLLVAARRHRRPQQGEDVEAGRHHLSKEGQTIK